eukprot:2791794-Rhodomonas_salina.4
MATYGSNVSRVCRSSCVCRAGDDICCAMTGGLSIAGVDGLLRPQGEQQAVHVRSYAQNHMH